MRRGLPLSTVHHSGSCVSVSSLSRLADNLVQCHFAPFVARLKYLDLSMSRNVDFGLRSPGIAGKRLRYANPVAWWDRRAA